MLIVAFCVLFIAVVICMLLDDAKSKVHTYKMLKADNYKREAFKGSFGSFDKTEEDAIEAEYYENVFSPLANGLRCGDYVIDTEVKRPVALIEFVPENV